MPYLGGKKTLQRRWESIMTGKCNRCGQCCERLGIGYSPDELRKAYLKWIYKDKPKELKAHKVVHAQEIGQIYLIYPMLRFRSKSKNAAHWYYYTCKHFTRDRKGKGVCTIHDIKPDMCADFPYYNHAYSIRIGQAAENPTTYKGCGYNR